MNATSHWHPQIQPNSHVRQTKSAHPFSDDEAKHHLFCMAIDEKNEAAWFELQQGYWRLVRSWIVKRIASLFDDEIEELIQQTFAKFWWSLSRLEKKVAEAFSHVGKLLGYLKQCAVTVSIDHERWRQRQRQIEANLRRKLQTEWQEKQQAVQPDCGQLNTVESWVKRRIHAPEEQLLLKLLFVYDMKPREIVACYPEQFASKTAVYRMRERILKRARRELCPKAT